jgi:ribonuclease HI
VSPEPSGDSPALFPESKSGSSPGEESILRHLAQTLSVAKTLKRFPSLQPRDLRELLLKCAGQIQTNQQAAPSTPERKKGIELFVHTDGASRGNPGEAGAGIVISDVLGRTVKEFKAFLGVATNNVAEYRAAILGLEKALELGAGNLTLYLDSELVGRQIKGEYKVREDHLKPLHRQATDLLGRFFGYHIECVAREENRRADQLANEAIDQRKE